MILTTVLLSTPTAESYTHRHINTLRVFVLFHGLYTHLKKQTKTPNEETPNKAIRENNVQIKWRCKRKLEGCVFMYLVQMKAYNKISNL